MPKLNKRGISLICILLVLATLLCGCAPAISQVTDTIAPDPSQEPSTSVPDPDPSYTSDKYHIISKEEYYDKTTAGFLSQLVGFLSGHEYSKSSDGKCAVAMPDSKFRYLDGLYASNAKADKHSKNISSGLWEVWFDDDFSVDIVNQYILGDMYRQKGTVCQKYITAGWISYDVWDMGGGQRQAGAYGAIKRNNYLPQFSGNTEYENWYSFLSEAYIATDTLGMSAAGMPETAAYHAGVFAQTTGDRDNVLWAQMFSTYRAATNTGRCSTPNRSSQQTRTSSRCPIRKARSIPCAISGPVCCVTQPRLS